MYIINDGMHKCEDINSVKQFLLENADAFIDKEEFDNFVNETNDPITIFDIKYLPSSVLAKVDPDFYNTAKDSYYESIVDEYISKMENYGIVNVRGRFIIEFVS